MPWIADPAFYGRFYTVVYLDRRGCFQAYTHDHSGSMPFRANSVGPLRPYRRCCRPMCQGTGDQDGRTEGYRTDVTRPCRRGLGHNAFPTTLGEPTHSGVSCAASGHRVSCGVLPYQQIPSIHSDVSELEPRISPQTNRESKYARDSWGLHGLAHVVHASCRGRGERLD